MKIKASDGFEIPVSFYESEHPTGVVIINSATGVPRKIYDKFSKYLQSHGFHVFSYDYRGVGEGAPKEFGVKAIGHFGAFREKFRETLWPLMAEALRVK